MIDLFALRCGVGLGLLQLCFFGLFLLFQVVVVVVVVLF